MCGILGAMPVQEKELFKRSLNLLAHRGPDGEGFWSDDSISLGHRRLSILDLSDSGKQPMLYENRFVVTFNGEIYNFIELREELKILGHHFRGSSDTEVLIASFVQWGQECVKKFNGMWAFAIWDRNEKKLFLSRDRMGEKQLYYHWDGSTFIFASEQKSILPFLKTVKVSSSFSRMVARSYEYESTPDTLFEGIKKIPSGSNAWFINNKFKIDSYWSVLDSKTLYPSNYEDQVKYLQELLVDSCKIRMRSDVPIGSALSGGVDSSAVAAAVAQVIKHSPVHHFRNSFVATYPGRVMDESSHALRIANKLNLKHTEVVINVKEHIPNLERICFLMEDIHEVNPIPHVALYGEMRKAGVKVTLDGHGGDEIFCGYESSVLNTLPDASFDFNDIQEILETYHSIHPQNEYFNGLSHFEIIQYLLKTELRQVKNLGLSKVLALKKKFGSLGTHLYEQSFRTVLPTLLRNYDRYAMINSVEIRMPLLDYRVVEFGFALSWNSKVRDGYTKKILRDAAAPWLDGEVIYRRDKLGFAPPIVDWFKHDMKEYVFDEMNSSQFRESDLINSKKFKKNLEGLIAGTSKLTLYETEQLWKNFHVYLWEKVFLKQKFWQ